MAQRRLARGGRRARLTLTLALGTALGVLRRCRSGRARPRPGGGRGTRRARAIASTPRGRIVATGAREAAAAGRVPLGEVRLAADAPRSHTVVRGDTLWDISARFLDEPWLWPTVWGYNPQIANPHLIYPGDVVALGYDADGKPYLRLDRDGRRVRVGGEPRLGAADDVTRLSPRVRSESLDDAVPMISGDTIRQFLVYPRVLDLDTIEKAPYVVGNLDERLIGASGNRIYARGDIRREQTRYGIYRRGDPLTDPATGELLGHEITHVAEARLLNVGDPSTLLITGNERETISGDILLPASGRSGQHQYVTRLPAIEGEGRIVSLVDAISQSGRNQVVVLNVGERAGIAIGDVLAIESRGGSLLDERGPRRPRASDPAEHPHRRGHGVRDLREGKLRAGHGIDPPGEARRHRHRYLTTSRPAPGSPQAVPGPLPGRPRRPPGPVRAQPPVTVMEDVPGAQAPAPPAPAAPPPVPIAPVPIAHWLALTLAAPTGPATCRRLAQAFPDPRRPRRLPGRGLRRRPRGTLAPRRAARPALRGAPRRPRHRGHAPPRRGGAGLGGGGRGEPPDRARRSRLPARPAPDRRPAAAALPARLARGARRPGRGRDRSRAARPTAGASGRTRSPRDLAAAGVVVVSGLALGTDAAAHAGALAGRGATLAFTATGIDTVYPRRHAPLARALLERGGAMASEFPLGHAPQPWCFPQRNRLISGASLAVVVIEAALPSGSLITARHALEQGREVMAVPGAVDNPQSRGCHALIRDGAALVTDAAEVLQLLAAPLTRALEEWPAGGSPGTDEPDRAGGTDGTGGPEAGDTALPVRGDPAELEVWTLLAGGPASLDQLVARATLSVPALLGALSALELEGLVLREGGNRYARRPSPPRRAEGRP